MDRVIEVKINGAYVTKDGQNAGSQGEVNATALRIEFDEGWDGFAKTITWWDAKGENPTSKVLTVDLLEDITASTRVYLTTIPAEALAVWGKCSFCVDGYINGKRQCSAYASLVVKPKGDGSDVRIEQPSPSQIEQLQVQIDTMLADMQAEAVRAEAAAKKAEMHEEGTASHLSQTQYMLEEAARFSEYSVSAAREAATSAAAADAAAVAAADSEANAQESAMQLKSSATLSAVSAYEAVVASEGQTEFEPVYIGDIHDFGNVRRVASQPLQIGRAYNVSFRYMRFEGQPAEEQTHRRIALANDSKRYSVGFEIEEVGLKIGTFVDEIDGDVLTATAIKNGSFFGITLTAEDNSEQDGARQYAMMANNSYAEAQRTLLDTIEVADETRAAAAEAMNHASAAANSERLAAQNAENAYLSERGAGFSKRDAESAAARAANSETEAKAAADRAEQAAENAGGGTQSDWQENDESSPAYVKNRPFGYYGEASEELVRELIEYTTHNSSRGTVSAIITNWPEFMFFEDQTYYIDIEDAHYELSGVQTAMGTWEPVIGNAYLYDSSEADTGEDICAHIMASDANQLEIIVRTEEGLYATNVGTITKGPVKVGEEWLPNNLATQDWVMMYVDDSITNAIGAALEASY